MVTSRQFKSALIAALISAASAYPGQAQPVPQAPAGNAVPVTADNFNRAETDVYFGKRVKKGGRIGNLSHSRELYLTDSPVVRPNRLDRCSTTTRGRLPSRSPMPATASCRCR